MHGGYETFSHSGMVLGPLSLARGRQRPPRTMEMLSLFIRIISQQRDGLKLNVLQVYNPHHSPCHMHSPELSQETQDNCTNTLCQVQRAPYIYKHLFHGMRLKRSQAHRRNLSLQAFHLESYWQNTCRSRREEVTAAEAMRYSAFSCTAVNRPE